MSKIENFKMYINGEWEDSSSGKKIETNTELTELSWLESLSLECQLLK